MTRVGIAAAGERVPVRAVRRDEVVLVAQGTRGADDRRLLADREVQEAADLGLGVHLARALLEAADEHHRLQPLTGDVVLREAGVRGGVRERLCHPWSSLPAGWLRHDALVYGLMWWAGSRRSAEFR